MLPVSFLSVALLGQLVQPRVSDISMRKVEEGWDPRNIEEGWDPGGGDCHARGELLSDRICRPVWVPPRAGDPPPGYELPAWVKAEPTPDALRVVGTRWGSVGWQRAFWYRDVDPAIGWQMVRFHKPLRDAENPPPWVGVR